jgi:hypothetical protein
MATSIGTKRQKWLWTLQPIIRISVLLQIYGYNYENSVWKINVNLLKPYKC